MFSIYKKNMKNPSLSIVSVLLLIGSAQGLFLFFALLRLRKGNIAANRWLSCLLLVLSICLIDGFMEETGYYLRFPHFIGLEWPTNFAYGPLIFLYIQSLTKKGRKSAGWKHALHFIPVILLYLYLIPLFSLTAEEKALYWTLSNNTETANTAYQIDPAILLVVIQLAVYIVLSIRMLVYYSARIKEKFSTVEIINLAWLQKLLIAVFILWLMYAFVFIFSGFFGVYQQAFYFLHLLVASVIYVMGFKGLARPEVFTALETGPSEEDMAPYIQPEGETDSDEMESSENALKPQEGKYKKSALTDEQAELILSRLTGLMEKEQPHLEMGLTLPELSDMLSVSSNHLSQVINERLNKSFFDFVNGYRIEEAKQLLISPASTHLSILGIGMDAGFSSKSSFYSAFKKMTGMTPSKFKAQYSESNTISA